MLGLAGAPVHLGVGEVDLHLAHLDRWLCHQTTPIRPGSTGTGVDARRARQRRWRRRWRQLVC
ncbi:MAG: hypothetical protein ACRDY7_11815 [Acidimicrobiia bacterium]